MTAQHDELDRINMPALSERALCQRLINENLNYVQFAADQLSGSKGKRAIIKTFMSIDVVVDARDLLTVADEMGMLPPNLKARIPVERDAAKTVEPIERESCPQCSHGKLHVQTGGGVKCDKCNYWFCY